MAGFARKWFPWAFAVLIAAFGVYWVKFKPVEVSGHRVTHGEVAAEVMGTGTLEARFQTTVSSKISGRIVEILVDQNDQVKQGQLMARLDDTELGKEVAIARAVLDAAKATV